LQRSLLELQVHQFLKQGEKKSPGERRRQDASEQTHTALKAKVGEDEQRDRYREPDQID
jgi:hypothetical protein